MEDFDLPQLDSVTREHMIAELESDIADGTLVGSKDFNHLGTAEYPAVMRIAVTRGTIASLATSLRPDLFNSTRTDKNGKISRLNLADAAVRFAGGEFNRFYLRGLCLRAQAEGVMELVVYRARHSANLVRSRKR